MDQFWLIFCGLLVFLMIFGLGLMGSGVVRFKNSLSQLIQTLLIIPHGLLLFSLVIGPVVYGGLGPADFFYQCSFFLIAQAILVGVWAERMSLKKMLLFVNLWGLVVYLPVAYAVWSSEGFILKMNVVDFAGGLVIHVTTGFSALAMTYLARRRVDYFKLIKHHSNPQIFCGLIFLWLGWFGFNGGSAQGFDNQALSALLNTFITPAFSLLIWFWIDLIHTPHRSSLLHLSMAVVAGLVMVTPSAGLISTQSAAILGVLAGVFTNYSVRFMHKVFNQDDVMEVFSTHGLTGLCGTLFLCFFLPGAQASTQLIAGVGVAAYSFLMTFAVIKIFGVDFFLVKAEKEESGLDIGDHGEYVQNIPKGGLS